jgi:hypothetical protein
MLVVHIFFAQEEGEGLFLVLQRRMVMRRQAEALQMQGQVQTLVEGDTCLQRRGR